MMTINNVTIGYLKNHPEFIDPLARYITEHWQPILKHDSVEARKIKLRAHLNFDKFPIAWVAFSKATVFGTAALRVHDLETHQHLTPWLGGVFVLPEFRNRGIGSQLCKAVELHAKHKFNIQKLFLFTLDQQAMYSRLGWKLMEHCAWHDRPGVIMEKDLKTA